MSSLNEAPQTKSGNRKLATHVSQPPPATCCRFLSHLRINRQQISKRVSDPRLSKNAFLPKVGAHKC